MNKLTTILMAGALAISAGLAFAQSQMNTDDALQGHKLPGMDMSGHTMSASQPVHVYSRKVAGRAAQHDLRDFAG